MKDKAIQKTIDDIQVQLSKLESVPDFVQSILNLVELMAEKINKLEEENQQLKNEITRLKGGNLPPNVRKQSEGKNNLSSEKERKNRRKKGKSKKGGSKKSKAKIDKTVTLEIDKKDLPADAKLAGIKNTVIQDVKLVTENIQFQRQMYYSASEKKRFVAPLPPGYEGEYGPNIKAWIKLLYISVNASNNNITWFLNTIGVLISNATVSRIITADPHNEELHKEKKSIVKAGLLSTNYHHFDDTSGREKGKNCYVNVLTNDLYAAFFTTKSKDRLNAIEILSVDGLKFVFNDLTFTLMAKMNLPEKHSAFLKEKTARMNFARADIDDLLAEMFPNPNKHQGYRKIILESAAIAAYRLSDYAISLLIADDAPQFKLITEKLGLCWVHEGRHYKKIHPAFKSHEKLIERFLERFWDYYGLLKEYQKTPSSEFAQKLENEFDELFGLKTGYEKLDDQIAKTKAKKSELLLVLEHPEIRLHNNPAELVARVQARIRDVHLHTMSVAGTKIKDTLATITMTAWKLGVNAFDYLYGRLTENDEMLSLAELIKIRSGEVTGVASG